MHHYDLALRIATDGICLLGIACPDRWHWRTAAVDCAVIGSLFLALLNLLWASFEIITPTFVRVLKAQKNQPCQPYSTVLINNENKR